MFYVSPKGNDNNPGTIDQPFLTLAKAVEETRKSNAEKKIILESGTYDNTHVTLDQRDSGLFIGSLNCYKNKPVLRGGIKATGWQHEGGDLYSLKLPLEVPTDTRILEINGSLKPRTRFPQTGFAKHLIEYEVIWLSTSGGGFETMPTDAERNQLVYDPADIPADFDWRDTEVSVMHRWDESLVCVQSHDAANHKIKFSTLCGNPPGSFKVQEFVVWNSAYNMAPGHWRVDKTTRTIYYRALPGESMTNPHTYLPIHNTIIKISDTVKDLKIENLSFSTTVSPLVNIHYHKANMPNTYGTMDIPGAIDSTSTLTNCEFTNLDFNNIGGWGIRLNGENSSINVKKCTVANSGGGGIRIKNGKDSNVIANEVRNIGLVHYSAIAIYISGCNVCENIVENAPYTGISLTDGPGTVMENNQVRKVMQILNDGAGIYATFGDNGIMRGNIVENIPHTGHPHSQRHGLYIDEQANGWIAEGNITINCTSAFLSHMNYKGGNTIRNNVFASHEGDVMLLLMRCNDHAVAGNTFHAKGAVIFVGNESGITQFEDNNIYSATGKIQQIHVNYDYEWGTPTVMDNPIPLNP